jgi:hypothetical protein
MQSPLSPGPGPIYCLGSSRTACALCKFGNSARQDHATNPIRWTALQLARHDVSDSRANETHRRIEVTSRTMETNHLSGFEKENVSPLLIGNREMKTRQSRPICDFTSSIDPDHRVSPVPRRRTRFDRHSPSVFFHNIPVEFYMFIESFELVGRGFCPSALQRQAFHLGIHSFILRFYPAHPLGRRNCESRLVCPVSIYQRCLPLLYYER